MKLFPIFIALTLTSSTLAAKSNEGFFLGISLAETRMNLHEEEYNFNEDFSENFANDSNSYQLSLGYQYNDFVSAKFSYHNYNDISFLERVRSPLLEEHIQDDVSITRIELDAISASINGEYLFHSDFSVFGSMGAIVHRENVLGHKALISAGLTYHLAELDIKFGYEVYKPHKEDFEGDAYIKSVDSLYVSLVHSF